MGAAARRRGDTLIRRQLDEETRQAYTSAATRAWAEVTIIGKTRRGHWDISVWYETADGARFGFCRLEVAHPSDIKEDAARAFWYWCRTHGYSMERVFWPAALESFNTKGV